MRLKALLLASLAVLLVGSAGAQTRLDGTIVGRVTDSQGLPVPGATVTVSGPALIQSAVEVSDGDGRYRAVRLPPGQYALVVKMDGFKTTEFQGIDVQVGRDLTIDVTIEPSPMSETVTVQVETPVIDARQVKNTQTITKEVIDQLPLARNAITAPTQLAPGVVERTSAGSGRNETNYLVDGANVQAPDQGFSEANISWDAIEEIEFVTTTNPIENYGSIGGTLNLVTRSGSNRFGGMGSYYFTNSGLSQVLLPPEAASALRIGQPSLKEFERDLSGRFSGPIMKDKLWFVVNARRVEDDLVGSFVPVNINGTQYNNYNAPYTQDWFFTKVTSQLAPSVRLFGSWNYTKGDRQFDFTVPARRTQEATRHWSSKEHTGSSQLTWTISNRTLLDARFGLWRFNYSGKSQPGTSLNPAFFDEFTLYEYGRWPAGFDATDKRNYNGSVSISHNLTNRTGSHDLKGGFEYQDLFGGYFFWSENSVQQWRTFNGNPYYYRALNGLTGPHPVLGDGLITLTTASTVENGSGVPSIFERVGVFASDIWQVNDRLTLNLGLRYDNTDNRIQDVRKLPADPLAQAVGEAVFMPRWGINPFGELNSPGQDGRIPWKGFSTQIGVTYALTADRKTVLKGSFGSYQERLLGWHFNFGVPSGGTAFAMNWTDLNNNGQLDAPGVDRWVQANDASPVGLIGTSWQQNIDPNIKTPYMNEYRASIERQIGDFNIGAAGIHRDRKNQMSDLLYDLNTGQYWSGVESGYWVPFETTVPSAGADFPAVPVTAYFQRRDAPAAFNRLTTIPNATARYTALDLTAYRRWRGDWMLGGSVVLAKNYGNYEIAGSTGRGQFQTPNFLTNREDARQPFDRPVQVKLWGSVMLPARVLSSFNFIYFDGSPWNRTVTIQPPAGWAAANGTTVTSQTVWLETRGDRRNQSTANLDVRFEKQFDLGTTRRLGLFVDVFNLTGFSYLTFQPNPGGTWAPEGPNTTAGRFTPAAVGPLGQVGVRTVRLSARFTF